MNRIPTRQLPLGAGHGAPLPYDALVEYVESTGAQYVNTGASIAVGSFRINAEFTEPYNATRGFFGLIGDADSGTTAQRRLFAWQTASGYSIDRGTAGSRISGTGDSLPTSKIGFAIVLDTPKTIYLFAVNGYSTRGIGLVRSLSLWDAQGNLVRDFAPCRVGTAGALYDRVSGTLFYSATSTALIPGPDLP